MKGRKQLDQFASTNSTINDLFETTNGRWTFPFRQSLILRFLEIEVILVHRQKHKQRIHHGCWQIFLGQANVV